MVYKNFLNSRDIELIMSQVDKLEWTEGGTAGDTVKHRVVKTANIYKYHNIRSKVGRQIVEHNNDYKYDIKSIPEMRMLHYTRGGKYDWHQDVNWATKDQRKFTFIIQLSDPESYVGGDLVFRDADNIDLTHVREQGSIIIFPSMLYHRITPVKKGHRYSIVGWATGPRWK